MAPTDPLPVVRYDAKDHQRSLDVMRWGLVPFWAKDIKVGFANINAKAEGIEKKPAFREAFRQRRCLVPVDNFYEWQKTRFGQAALRDRPERRRPDGAGGVMGELALAGRRAGAQLRDHHHGAERIVRPICITGCPWCSKPEAWPQWLGEEPADEARLKSLLAPYPSDGMICWPVSARVGNVRNNDPSLIEPISEIA